MSIFFPTPSVFVGGAQPFANALGNVPSEAAVVAAAQPWGGLAALAGLLAQWQPVDPPAQLPRRLPPVITAVRVDNPPAIARWTAARFAWDAEAVLPRAPRYGVPAPAAAGAGTSPPGPVLAWLSAVLASWRPADFPPTLRGRLPPPSGYPPLSDRSRAWRVVHVPPDPGARRTHPTPIGGDRRIVT